MCIRSARRSGRRRVTVRPCLGSSSVIVDQNFLGCVNQEQAGRQAGRLGGWQAATV
jgi:hypothetical protein